jgi:GNAT superfamily N-acetyltransferase
LSVTGFWSKNSVDTAVRIEPLSELHDRSAFVSGSEALDRYFRTQASQDQKRRIATCFVAVIEGSPEVAGYYTLTATSIPLDALSPQIVKKLPRYPVVPAALLGRLAVARIAQGRGLGGVLLADALKRTSRAELGVFAMIVDAKGEVAQRFYEHYGFTLLPGDGRRLCLPIDAALQRLAEK